MSLTLCVLLWPEEGRDAELVAYEDRVLELLGDHGGRVLQRLRNHDADPSGSQPLEVQVIEFPSEVALDAYLHDDRRTALAGARDRAIARTELLHVAVV
jgi:uncharacterized protein (DUF1330 family)